MWAKSLSVSALRTKPIFFTQSANRMYASARFAFCEVLQITHSRHAHKSFSTRSSTRCMPQPSSAFTSENSSSSASRGSPPSCPKASRCWKRRRLAGA